MKTEEEALLKRRHKVCVEEDAGLEVVDCIWDQDKAESFDPELERLEDAIRARKKRVLYIRKHRQKEPPKTAQVLPFYENLLEILGLSLKERSRAKIKVKANGRIHIYYGGEGCGDGPGHGHMVVVKRRDTYEKVFDRKPLTKRGCPNAVEVICLTAIPMITL